MREAVPQSLEVSSFTMLPHLKIFEEKGTDTFWFEESAWYFHIKYPKGLFQERGFSPNTSRQTRILIHIFLKPQAEDNSLAFSIIYIGLHNR